MNESGSLTNLEKYFKENVKTIIDTTLAQNNQPEPIFSRSKSRQSQP